MNKNYQHTKILEKPETFNQSQIHRIQSSRIQNKLLTDGNINQKMVMYTEGCIMHVKTLGYPIGCPPKVFNEDYHSLRFFIQQG